MPKDAAVRSQDDAHAKARPGRKRLGEEVFVPVTIKVEPAELATIESIAKYSGRSRSDVMRQMLSYGLAHMMQAAFGGSDSAGAEPSPASEAPDRSRTIVGTYLPAYELDVLGTMSDIAHQSRSKVLRRAIERALPDAPGGEADE